MLRRHSAPTSGSTRRTERRRCGEQVNASRWEAELNHGFGLHEIRFGEAQASEAEKFECPEQMGHVDGSGRYPDVEVARVPRVAVRSERIAAHQQVINPDGVE